ncbi:hypothetical protein QYE76_062437 [Lolium multiflorum]|uniref:DNA-directed RNA polymerase subunit n=1 Tax=Lolium multiflorum TaxID=4521 RepID=A0AAD8S373_LOLMU|nr:hypothetical protein QYE76_062437 [Lolium multiflorum]
MATTFWKARDFLFCGVCGTLLDLDNIRYASCPLCGFKRMAKDIEDKETRYSITAEDMRRQLKTQPFVDVVVQKTVIDGTCPKCKHNKLEYDQRQLRSADEGATTFYECPKCNYRFNEN